jgi:hypothetical protein
VTQAGPVGQSILAELSRQATTKEQWTADRAPCLECDDLTVCGGFFARGDGAPCPETARKLVERLRAVGAEIRAVLNK